MIMNLMVFLVVIILLRLKEKFKWIYIKDKKDNRVFFRLFRVNYVW